MWRFASEASDRLEDLVDQVTLADATFNEVIKYFGEEDKTMTSTEFFGIFKTFVTSYKVWLTFSSRIFAAANIFLQILSNIDCGCG